LSILSVRCKNNNSQIYTNAHDVWWDVALTQSHCGLFFCTVAGKMSHLHGCRILSLNLSDSEQSKRISLSAVKINKLIFHGECITFIWILLAFDFVDLKPLLSG